jgi:hypothetical protein
VLAFGSGSTPCLRSSLMTASCPFPAAHEGFCEDLARQNAVTQLSRLQLRFRRRHIWVSVIAVVSQRPLFRTPHGLLGYQRSSALFRPVCPSLSCRSDWLANPIACASFPRLTLLRFVDSLDSELWYRSRCRAAVLGSSSTEAIGQSFRQLFTTRSAPQG